MRTFRPALGKLTDLLQCAIDFSVELEGRFGIAFDVPIERCVVFG